MSSNRTNGITAQPGGVLCSVWWSSSEILLVVSEVRISVFNASPTSFASAVIEKELAGIAKKLKNIKSSKTCFIIENIMV
jgi:hypothetical protein